MFSHFGGKYANHSPSTMRLILESLLTWVQDKSQYHHLAAVKVQTTKYVNTYSFYVQWLYIQWFINECSCVAIYLFAVKTIKAELLVAKDGPFIKNISNNFKAKRSMTACIAAMFYFVIFHQFLPLYSPNNLKNQNFEKMKKKNCLEISSFYTCVPHVMIIWCMIPEI